MENLPRLCRPYPRIPFTTAPAVILHRGEVTANSIRTFDQTELFLYSTLARPGNSGGPIISASGYVIGIVSEQLAAKDQAFDQPFYAGVGAGEILRALQELDRKIPFPWEDYN